MSGIDYTQKIPNNINLAGDRTLQRALEHWQPQFLNWWHELGPSDFEKSDVYLRTATSVDAEGWAQYGAVKMPDYRWGIFLADAVNDRRIGFGDQMGQPVWQQVPGEYRSTLRRLIVTQGDTEPASVFQRDGVFLVCTSTYGQGDIPDNSKALFADLSAKKPDLSAVRYGVFSLGDRTYAETFNFGGIKWDKLLETLGAKRIGERVQCDAASGQLPEERAMEWGNDWLELAKSETAPA